MDIPYALKTTLGTIPLDTPYLFPDLKEVQFFKRLSSSHSIRRIGVCWAGRPSHENDQKRSLTFSQLEPLLAHKDIEWVSLQRVVPDRDMAAFSKSSVLNWMVHYNDFASTAAAIMTLDLVITVDTAIAHLAGALGKPLWILLPFFADWRWLMKREDSPWYPTATLFRQQKRRDWESVITQIAARLS